MIEAWSVEAVRRAERAAMARLPTGALMQRAAGALAGVVAGELRRIVGRLYGARVQVWVGSGDNGGDALFAGARLARRGARVEAVVVAVHAHEGGLAALRSAGGEVRRGSGSRMIRPDVVVDGILGIGGQGGLRGAAAAVVQSLPAGVPVVAVDMPSGVDADNGQVHGIAAQADVTVTFGVPKAAVIVPPGAYRVGRVVVADIGLSAEDLGAPVARRWEVTDVARAWPTPSGADDKYRRGVLGVIAGGDTYAGAAVLCCGAAVRVGAGMVRYEGPQQVADRVTAAWPQVVSAPGRVQAWVIGPGISETDRDQHAAAQRVMESEQPIVVDAGALMLIDRPRLAPTILTPHAGELARLLTRLMGLEVHREEIARSPWEYVRQAADLTGAVVLLKGSVTMIAAPGDATVVTQQDAPSWLGTAGAGDVLAGVVGMLLAAGVSPVSAAAMGVVTHGTAAWQASAGGPVDAQRVLDFLPAAVSAILQEQAVVGQGFGGRVGE
ncbi:MAG: bifunctional ADP-dependent NAD(P)H-hydrate dehydratase/NAD(P)H-hydrate epimerase [Actinomycetota bacterium]